MGTKTGLNGITFGDATVQNTAAVTGVSSAVAGSGISVSGATGAVTFTNSGVTSIVAGTGISISGGTGAVTVTASGGGVTSLNGQSGAITNTDYGSIGSYMIAADGNGNNSGVAKDGNTTVAGSTLYRNTWANETGFVLNTFTHNSDLSAGVATTFTSLSLSGTWRRITYSKQNVYNGAAAGSFNLYVRVS
jgi:hypothetical protein